MADHNDEIKAEDVKAEEQTDASEEVKDLEPRKDVKGGGRPYF